jgi:hypothetical protein
VAFEDDFRDVMADSVAFAAPTSVDAYGRRTMGAAVTYCDCRVQAAVHKVLDASGQERVAYGRVYLPGFPAISVNARMTLPDGSQPPILAVVQVSDEKGPHHTVVHWGSTSA